MPDGLRSESGPLADVLGDLCLLRLELEYQGAVDSGALERMEDAIEDLHFRIKRAPVVTLGDARAMAALAAYLQTRPEREADAATMQAWLIEKLRDGVRR